MSSQQGIMELELALGATLPADLKALYEQGDGEANPWRDKWPMHLLPLGTALSEYRELRRSFPLYGSCPFWEDYAGHRATMYLTGPLRGRVGFWRFESGGPDDPVAYRSAASFVATMDEAAKSRLDWYEMPTDYLISTALCRPGSRKPATPEEIESDRTAFQALLAAYDSGASEDHAARNAIALAPPDETGAILRFLDSGNMYVQACNELGNRRYAPAIERLGQAARGHVNRLSAIAALGMIGTDQARDAILASVSALGPDAGLHISNALRDCGCETRSDADEFFRWAYFYRLPGEESWRPLR